MFARSQGQVRNLCRLLFSARIVLSRCEQLPAPDAFSLTRTWLGRLGTHIRVDISVSVNKTIVDGGTTIGLGVYGWCRTDPRNAVDVGEKSGNLKHQYTDYVQPIVSRFT